MTTDQTRGVRPGQAHVTWRKSQRSTAEHNCVEVARMGSNRAVRDSKNPDGDVLLMGLTDWEAMSRRIKRGEFNLM
ncbi:MAG: hypothetical protein JWN52_5577 [Actinomycetia bacterium]|nr:hypothetical protein [Actinomycetes bacterium]